MAAACSSHHLPLPSSTHHQVAGRKVFQEARPARTRPARCSEFSASQPASHVRAEKVMRERETEERQRQLETVFIETERERKRDRERAEQKAHTNAFAGSFSALVVMGSFTSLRAMPVARSVACFVLFYAENVDDD